MIRIKGGGLRPHAYRRAFVLGTGFAALIGISACGGSGAADYATNLEDTGAAIPDPCSLVSAPLARELVGTSSATRSKEAVRPDDSHPKCEWTNQRPTSAKSIQDSIVVQVSVQMKRQKTGDRFLQSRTAYATYTSGKKCHKIDLDAAESCWYRDVNDMLGVTVRKGYVVVWASVVGDDATALEAGKLPDTARRVANDIDKGIS